LSRSSTCRGFYKGEAGLTVGDQVGFQADIPSFKTTQALTISP
jgi:hypothetical protein